MFEEADVDESNRHDRTIVNVTVYGGADLIVGPYSNDDALIVNYRVSFNHDGTVTSAAW